MKRKEKAKFAKVNAIKFRYPIYRPSGRSDFHCFYFSQKTTNTFPNLCFPWLLFNLFLISKLNSIYSDLLYNCSPAGKWCFQWLIPSRSWQFFTHHQNHQLNHIWINCSTSKFFSVGDWVRLVCPIIPLRDSTMFILFCWKYQTRQEVFYPISRHREVSWIYNEIILSCLIISFLNEL